MPTLKPATLAEATALSQTLRPEDAAEIRAMTGRSPLASLIHGWRRSSLPVAILDDDGVTVGMFGVVDADEAPRTGVIWMLAAPGLLQYRRRFARESRQWIDALQTRYDVLFNVVDERNAVHIRWLRWCGFTFIRRHEALGVEQRPFLEFVRLADRTLSGNMEDSTADV